MSTKSPESRVSRVLRERYRYWLPHVDDRGGVERDLERFYETRADYHRMTADPGKENHPQVRLLLQTVRPTDLCIEFGCGGGVVLGAVRRKAGAVLGADISMTGLDRARRLIPDRNAVLVRADVARIPVRTGCADVAYSFEVLEHVWDPEAVLEEMARVLRPGGCLFFSTPNGYSLDLHLKRRWAIRLLDLAGAVWTWLSSFWSRRCFRNMEPDLDAVPPYADCDMITKMFPGGLERALRRLGCRIERMETFFFQAGKAATPEAARRYERLNSHPFYRYFGDHILVIARKAGD